MTNMDGQDKDPQVVAIIILTWCPQIPIIEPHVSTDLMSDWRVTGLVV